MPTSNLAEYTVTEISFALKRTVEDAYGLVRVRGELSGFKRAGSGHLYFCLKDERAVLDAVAWRNSLPRMAFEPADGLEVVCTGKLTTYPGRSKYQLTVEQMEPAGVGALMALLDERRRRLEAEGLFASERKRSLPLLPEVIGIVTSPTGAVIRDILHRLAERCPRRVIVWPVLVQGEGAAEQVAAAIEGFGKLEPSASVPRPDVLIVARGGGSIEDLWAFNEEIVVRAAAASPIPLISAVGHETDVTLIDHVADRRAPTPTAAAEMAVPVRAELLARLGEQGLRSQVALSRWLRERAGALEGLRRGLGDPAQALRMAGQRLDDLAERLRLRTPAAVLHAQAELLGSRTRRLAELTSDLLARRGQALTGLDRRLGLELLAEQLAIRKRAFEREQARLGPSIQRLVTTLDAKLERAWDLCRSLGPRAVLERGYVLARSPMDRAVVTKAGEAASLPELLLTFADGELTVSTRAGPAPRRRRPGGDPAETPTQPTLL